MIKAVIFDFDGLIIDTETPWFQAFSEIYREHGAFLPLETWVQCVGADEKHFNPYDYLERCINRPVDRDSLRELSKQKFALFIKGKSINPGVLDCLKTAKSLGLKIGLASSSTRDWVEGFLKDLDLLDYFDYLCTREQVNKIKPAPDLYLKVLAHFGITGNQAIAFEDSPNGAKAAKAAGIYCVIVPRGITSNLQFEQYDLKVNSLEDLNLVEVVASFK